MRRGLCNQSYSTGTINEKTMAHPGILVTTTSDNLDILIGAKDDLTFGCIIGPPLMWNTYAASS
jgi:hypothetical protein